MLDFIIFCRLQCQFDQNAGLLAPILITRPLTLRDGLETASHDGNLYWQRPDKAEARPNPLLTRFFELLKSLF